MAIIRDRTLRTSLGGSSIKVASDWTMLIEVDREAGVYLSQYIPPKYPGVVKFLSTSLRPCLTVGNTDPNQFNEDHIIDEMLFGHGLDVLIAFGILLALNPDILNSWESDVPFAGASTASCFNVMSTVEALEKLFTPPVTTPTPLKTRDVVRGTPCYFPSFFVLG